MLEFYPKRDTMSVLTRTLEIHSWAASVLFWGLAPRYRTLSNRLVASIPVQTFLISPSLYIKGILFDLFFFCRHHHLHSSFPEAPTPTWRTPRQTNVQFRFVFVVVNHSKLINDAGVIGEQRGPAGPVTTYQLQIYFNPRQDGWLRWDSPRHYEEVTIYRSYIGSTEDSVSREMYPHFQISNF